MSLSAFTRSAPLCPPLQHVQAAVEPAARPAFVAVES